MPLNQPAIPPATDTTTAATGEPVIVKRDFNDVDSLISEVLNQQREKIGAPPAEASPDAVSGSNPFNPVPQPNRPPWDTEPAEPLDPEAAKRSGLRMAKTIDGMLSLGASAYAKEKERKKYQASEGELNDLADPLSELSVKYDFQLSPEIRLMFLLVTIYSPKFMQAANDRRINELNSKIADLERREKEREERLRDLERKAAEKEKEIENADKK